MTNMVTKEYGDTALRIKDGDKWIFFDAIPIDNPINIVVQGSSAAFALSRDDVATLRKWLGDKLSDFDERNKPVPLSEQVRALEPGTRFKYASNADMSTGALWFRTQSGVVSVANFAYSDEELAYFFDGNGHDGAIAVVA